MDEEALNLEILIQVTLTPKGEQRLPKAALKQVKIKLRFLDEERFMSKGPFDHPIFLVHLGTFPATRFRAAFGGLCSPFGVKVT